MLEWVDSADLKSAGGNLREGSSPSPATKKSLLERAQRKAIAVNRA